MIIVVNKRMVAPGRFELPSPGNPCLYRIQSLALKGSSPTPLHLPWPLDDGATV